MENIIYKPRNMLKNNVLYKLVIDNIKKFFLKFFLLKIENSGLFLKSESV